MIAAGYSVKQLKEAGYTYNQLKEAKFTEEQLDEGGFATTSQFLGCLLCFETWNPKTGCLFFPFFLIALAFDIVLLPFKIVRFLWRRFT
jgi:hypothetical protein